MDYYFDNAGIIENLPAQPINKAYKNGMYIAIAIAVVLGGTCIWLSLERTRATKPSQGDTEKGGGTSS